MEVVSEKKARSMVSHKLLGVTSAAPPILVGDVLQRVQNVPTAAGRTAVARAIAISHRFALLSTLLNVRWAFRAR